MNFLMLYQLNSLLKKKISGMKDMLKFTNFEKPEYLDVPFDMQKFEKKIKI